MDKKQIATTALTAVGAVTVAYFGLRAVAVAMDPQVHTALGTAVKSVGTAATRATAKTATTAAKASK